MLLRRDEVRLLLPRQVEVEFRRNRENKIVDALKRLREQKLNLQFPQLCKEYEEYDQLRELQRHYETAHARLLEKIFIDVSDETLKADGIIKELFNLAVRILTTDTVLAKARLRVELGNPPGKTGSLGDALNWESLLEASPNGEHIYFVTDDKDYSSPIDDSKFDPFLLDEWKNTKGSLLFFSNKLSSFFRERFPAIKLASEYEKEILIRDLSGSTSFSRTHSVIARLKHHNDFTQSQVNDIVSTCLGNSQIFLIMGDPDVMAFIRNITKDYKEQIDPRSMSQLCEVFKSRTGKELESLTTFDGELPF